MLRRRHVAVAAAAAAAVWAYFRRASVVPSPSAMHHVQNNARVCSVGVQTPGVRDEVEILVARYRHQDICYNVLYTAALYTLCPHVSLDTWTHSSLTDIVPLWRWMLLRGREKMMDKAFVFFHTSRHARARYAQHRAEAHRIAKRTGCP